MTNEENDDIGQEGNGILNRRELLVLMSPVIRRTARRLSQQKWRPSPEEDKRLATLRAFNDTCAVYSSVLAGGPLRGRTNAEENLDGVKVIFEDQERVMDPLDIRQQNRIANQGLNQGETSSSEKDGAISQNNSTAKPSTVGESSDPQDLENSQVGRKDDYLINPKLWKSPRRGSGQESLESSSPADGGDRASGGHHTAALDPGEDTTSISSDPALSHPPSIEGKGTTSFPTPERTIKEPPLPKIEGSVLTAREKKRADERRGHEFVSGGMTHFDAYR